MESGQIFLDSVTKRFRYYKEVGERALAQVSDDKLSLVVSEESNSLSVIIRHLHGNMMSRWTGFPGTDGEKEWRNRDDEFEPAELPRESLMALWNEGWERLFSALGTLRAGDLEGTTYIRGEAHTVLDAINRQLAHYPYHVGQIVLLCKMMSTSGWQTLTMPRRKK